MGTESELGQQYITVYDRFHVTDVGYIGAFANMGLSYIIPFGLFIGRMVYVL